MVIMYLYFIDKTINLFYFNKRLIILYILSFFISILQSIYGEGSKKYLVNNKDTIKIIIIIIHDFLKFVNDN